MTPNDFALARKLMVDGQLRPTKVNDKRILDAMRTLPRERFVPAEFAELALHRCRRETAGRTRADEAAGCRRA